MRRRPPIVASCLLLLCGWMTPSCASVKFERDTPTSGTFESSAWSFTIISFDIPGPAISIAQRNVASTGQPNLIIKKSRIVPHLGFFDILMDIISFRHAKISGTWGFPPTE